MRMPLVISTLVRRVSPSLKTSGHSFLRACCGHDTLLTLRQTPLASRDEVLRFSFPVGPLLACGRNTCLGFDNQRGGVLNLAERSDEVRCRPADVSARLSNEPERCDDGAFRLPGSRHPLVTRASELARVILGFEGAAVRLEPCGDDLALLVGGVRASGAHKGGELCRLLHVQTVTEGLQTVKRRGKCIYR